MIAFITAQIFVRVHLGVATAVHRRTQLAVGICVCNRTRICPYGCLIWRTVASGVVQFVGWVVGLERRFLFLSCDRSNQVVLPCQSHVASAALVYRSIGDNVVAGDDVVPRLGLCLHYAGNLDMYCARNRCTVLCAT